MGDQAEDEHVAAPSSEDARPTTSRHRGVATAVWLVSLIGAGLMALLIVLYATYFAALAITVGDSNPDALIVFTVLVVLAIALTLAIVTARWGRRQNLARWSAPTALVAFVLVAWFGFGVVMTIVATLVGP